MDCIHKVSVKNPYDFSHLIQDKLQHLQIGWLEKEKDSYSWKVTFVFFYEIGKKAISRQPFRIVAAF